MIIDQGLTHHSVRDGYATGLPRDQLVCQDTSHIVPPVAVIFPGILQDYAVTYSVLLRRMSV